MNSLIELTATPHPQPLSPKRGEGAIASLRDRNRFAFLWTYPTILSFRGTIWISTGNSLTQSPSAWQEVT